MNIRNPVHKQTSSMCRCREYSQVRRLGSGCVLGEKPLHSWCPGSTFSHVVAYVESGSCAGQLSLKVSLKVSVRFSMDVKISRGVP